MWGWLRQEQREKGDTDGSAPLLQDGGCRVGLSGKRQLDLHASVAHQLIPEVGDSLLVFGRQFPKGLYEGDRGLRAAAIKLG